MSPLIIALFVSLGIIHTIIVSMIWFSIGYLKGKRA